MSEFTLIDTSNQNAVIKVIGIGGGGGNAVSHMLHSNLDGVDFICANTDAQALQKIADNGLITVQIGANLTRGLGAGANPEIGHQAALEDRERISEAIQGADMVFITAGMGGGTGTGAAPVVAEVAKEQGILTVAVVTKPFPFEGDKRMRVAEEGIEELSKYVDSLITIPNEKLLKVLDRNTTLIDAFKEANNVLLHAVQGISELITRPGMINVDFADVRTVMSEMGMAMMGSGVASGEDRAKEAAEKAVSCPLLEDIQLSGARGILINVTASQDLGMLEFNEVGSIVRAFASPDANIIIGTAIDEELDDELRVTVVATGLGKMESVRLNTPNETESPAPAMTPEEKPKRQKYDSELDIPTHLRKKGVQNTPTNINALLSSKKKPLKPEDTKEEIKPDKKSDHILDIPAFLRQKD